MAARSVPTVVFLALVLDLFAFTIPLPLFPRLIEWYTGKESADSSGLLSRTLSAVGYFRSRVLGDPAEQVRKRWDVVLLGGLMGSLFSALQFYISPKIGSLSDKYGRRNVLLFSMIGNVLSALVWIQSTSFASYLLSRAIGGISEGNVQLSIAILSDVTTPATRARALSLVGIAFSICFCIGPPIGAYLSTHPFTPSLAMTGGYELNVYATPAILTLVLLLVETLFLAVMLPETRGKGAQPTAEERKSPATNAKSSRKTAASRLATLKRLRRMHFLFLAVFSGVEFTLTFLSFDLFDWSNAQNGRLLGFIGVISALLQGGYVRRSISKVGEGVMAKRGVGSCALALAFLALLPHLATSRRSAATNTLYAAATCLAFTSATVVNSLTALASLQCDEPTRDAAGKITAETPGLVKGRALGEFRSSGQLGRALGPLLACGLYWTLGPSTTYSLGTVAMTAIAFHMRSISRPSKKIN